MGTSGPRRGRHRDRPVLHQVPGVGLLPGRRWQGVHRPLPVHPRRERCDARHVRVLAGARRSPVGARDTVAGTTRPRHQVLVRPGPPPRLGHRPPEGAALHAGGRGTGCQRVGGHVHGPSGPRAQRECWPRGDSGRRTASPASPHPSAVHGRQGRAGEGRLRSARAEGSGPGGRQRPWTRTQHTTAAVRGRRREGPHCGVDPTQARRQMAASHGAGVPPQPEGCCTSRGRLGRALRRAEGPRGPHRVLVRWEGAREEHVRGVHGCLRVDPGVVHPPPRQLQRPFLECSTGRLPRCRAGVQP